MAEPVVPGARLVASADAVREAWERLAAAIQPLVDEGHCVLLGVLLGGMFPLVQVAGRLRGDFLIDYCHLTRYAGGATGGPLRWIQRPHLDLRASTVVLVDDVFDEGHTLAALRRHCEEAGAVRVRVAVLARKRHARAVAGFEPDFIGIEAGDEYLFGCGMDIGERWRHLDALFALPPA
jgi:hypoxanthine phosphoribosyltransferase